MASMSNPDKHLDGLASSAAIGRGQPRFAILPVGSCEQHGAHLPVLTDTLSVDHVAAVVGDRLGGFVLPTVPYGTSPEHFGFPGTVSLRWSTLAAVVTDIAESCFRQGIPTVFVVSGHGGNFILNPCIREMNSRLPDDQRLVLIPEGTYFGPELTSSTPDDFHAGRWETAVMLTLRDDLVDMEAAIDFVPANGSRAELTNRPFRSLTTSGVWGYPSEATREEGTAILAGTVERVTDYVQEWLRTEEVQHAST